MCRLASYKIYILIHRKTIFSHLTSLEFVTIFALWTFLLVLDVYAMIYKRSDFVYIVHYVFYRRLKYISVKLICNEVMIARHESL